MSRRKMYLCPQWHSKVVDTEFTGQTRPAWLWNPHSGSSHREDMKNPHLVSAQFYRFWNSAILPKRGREKAGLSITYKSQRTLVCYTWKFHLQPGKKLTHTNYPGFNFVCKTLPSALTLCLFQGANLFGKSTYAVLFAWNESTWEQLSP